MIADCVLPIEQFLEQIAAHTAAPVVFAGEGAQRYGDAIITRMGAQALLAPLSLNVGRAAHGALLARESFQNGTMLTPEQLLPDYIRPSEAELARHAKA